jgi:1,4-dihydroxy-2-naphthoate octaprenyltransferase
VRLGRGETRRLYVVLLAGAYLVLLGVVITGTAPGWAALGMASVPLAGRPLRAVLTRTDGPALNGALAGTGALLGAFSVLVAVGLLIAA